MADALTETVISALASAKHIPREQINLETTLESLGVDSLDKITLLFEIEERLNISVPDEQISGLRTVADVVEGVTKLAGQAPPQDGGSSV